MSAKEMCFVPTPDGAVEVPVGTAILLDDGTLEFAGKGGYWIRRNFLGNGYPISYGNHTVTIVAFPDGRGGWITPGATPEPKWVALTQEQVALLPDCTPVRIECDGVVTEGALHRERTRDGRVALHHSAGHWWTSPPQVVVHVHPEDVPDPDADLIERMAKAIHDRDCDCGELCEDDSPEAYRAMARAALAAFREGQA